MKPLRAGDILHFNGYLCIVVKVRPLCYLYYNPLHEGRWHTNKTAHDSGWEKWERLGRTYVDSK